jgi:hypothetical protein
MSERIVDNPGNHGWVEENGKWVWEGGTTTGHIEDGTIDGQITTWDAAKTEWMPNDAVVVDASGNVGVNSSNPAGALHVGISDQTVEGIDAEIFIGGNGRNARRGLIAKRNQVSTKALEFYSATGSTNADIKFFTNETNERMRIDADGNVGVGTENMDGAKLRVASPVNTLSMALGEHNLAARHLEIKSFAVSGYNGAGWDFNAKETSAGTITFSTGSTERMRIDASGNVDISGTVNANLYTGGFGAITTGGVADWNHESNCASGQAATMLRGNAANGPDGSNNYFHPFNFEYRSVSGNVTQLAVPYTAETSNIWMRSKYNGAWSAWKEVGGGSGGGGLPDGGYTYGWTITASDFIANSDERLKDDISPLPVGLIDDIKPVQWNWKDGSGKSAGVVAQQLQAIGLDDFVNEDADGNLGVNYNALVGVLLAEVISLKAEVESLK